MKVKVKVFLEFILGARGGAGIDIRSAKNKKAEENFGNG